MNAMDRFVAAALPPIESREEELALISRAQAGDRRAGDILWRSYTRYVLKLVRQFAARRKVSANLLFDDDIVAGIAVAFVDATRNKQPRGTLNRIAERPPRP